MSPTPVRSQTFNSAQAQVVAASSRLAHVSSVNCFAQCNAYSFASDASQSDAHELATSVKPAQSMSSFV